MIKDSEIESIITEKKLIRHPDLILSYLIEESSISNEFNLVNEDICIGTVKKHQLCKEYYILNE